MATSKQEENTNLQEPPAAPRVHYRSTDEVRIITSSYATDQDQDAAVGLVSNKIKPKQPRKMASRKDSITLQSICRSLLASKWIAAALVILLIANAVFFIGFWTNGWGRIRVGADTGLRNLSQVNDPMVSRLASSQDHDVYWNFGLWQTCRTSDNVCTGPRFPPFYGATRALSVLSLFFNILSFSWMLGHTLEQLLDIDPCTMATVASLCFASGTFTLMAVCIFGTRWPIEFKSDMHGVDATLQYSFYLMIAVIPMNYLAGTFTILDLYTSRIILDTKFYPEDPELQDEQDYADVLMVGSGHQRIHIWDKMPKTEPLALTKSEESVEKWFAKQGRIGKREDENETKVKESQM